MIEQWHQIWAFIAKLNSQEVKKFRKLVLTYRKTMDNKESFLAAVKEMSR